MHKDAMHLWRHAFIRERKKKITRNKGANNEYVKVKFHVIKYYAKVNTCVHIYI